MIAPRQSSRALPVSPLLLWLLVQLIALAAAVTRIPLTARFPVAPERWALQEMLAAQVLAGAMLFPWLLRDRRLTIVIIATAWPFVQLAAFLGAVPGPHTIAAAAAVSIWLATLGLWRSALQSNKSQLIGVAVAVLLAAAGPVLYYLNIEYAAGATTSIPPAAWSPILAAFDLVGSGAASVPGWTCLGICLLTGLSAWVVAGRSRSCEAHG